MSVIKYTWEVDKLSNVLTLFDVQKVYRSTTGIGGPFVEITTALTRVPLVAGQSVYTFDDVAGDATYYYTTSYYNSTTLLEGDQSDPILGVADLLILDVDDVREEGVTTSTASDAKILQQIRTWQTFVERATGNWFTAKAMTLDWDGRGTTLLQLPFPIVTVSALYVNEDFDNALDPDEYRVYNGRGGTERDDRRNPRIKLVTTDTSIFTGTGAIAGRATVFEVGEKNQRVVGTFGFVEPDGSVPAPIEYAILKLVVRGSKKLGTSGGGAFPAGPVVEEETDRHRLKYADPFVGSKMWPTTGDPEVDQIIARYRRATFTGGPRTMFHRNRRAGSF
jgi:hypothetical protein